MLKVAGLESAYGVSQVLFGIELEVNAGEVVTVLGRNGMGKTTTINSIMGIVTPRAGSVHFDGKEIAGARPFKIAQAGLGLVPEGRQIFPNLSVRENLVATAANRQGDSTPWTLERVYEMFPALRNRATSMGNLLSGGEQQMLAIGRALMTNPKLLILDEATEGLAPLVRDEIWECLQRIKDDGLSILVVDKNIADLIKLADRHYVIEKGKVVWSGTSDELKGDEKLQERYLGV
ncbi:MAG: ABC transporter ATP-binding protein [Alphaproteobacteria bacterium]|nr:ABC transporter ATP-binding protein [Alphaproteobacteria bacterium]